MRADQLRPDDDEDHAAPKRNRGSCEVGGKGKAQTFKRKMFRASRLADFATESELTKQTGQPVENWPLVVVKELADNALDDAEKTGVAPEIEIAVTNTSITVADQGSGIAPATVKAIVDYSFRMSSNAAYVSPTRGQQGNALQILFAMPYVLNGKEGEVLIESRGVAHAIRFTTDPVRQTPVVSRATSLSAVKNGTRVTVRWPNSPRSNLAAADNEFLSLAEHYGWFNPHLNLNMSLPADDEPTSWEATDPEWSKWRPSMPTSAHWYDAERLKLLMTAYIAHAEDHRTACLSVRDFISLFRGLSGTAKQNAICKAVGVAERTSLADFYQQDIAAAPALLQAMQNHSRPVKARDLGVIGRHHLLERMIEHDCDPESFVYRKRDILDDGLPTMIEAAFGYRSRDDEAAYGLRVIEGFNFSPAIGDSPFRLEQRLENADVEDIDPVTVFVHLTSPKLNFLDRGKARVSLPDTVNEALFGLIKGVTKDWTKQKRAEIRDVQARMRRRAAMDRSSKPMNQKDAAWGMMEASYLKASANDTLPANPRQIYYVARDPVEQKCGEAVTSKYFCQTLLPYFMAAYPDLTRNWKIAWDDRGHFREPHTNHEIGVGTLAVQGYIGDFHEPEIGDIEIADVSVATKGPAGRYGSILYIEKEGFDPIIEAAGIPERFDIAPMSCKGMSVTAGRMLVEELCGRLGLKSYILHDFDISGFTIKKTLHTSGRRYTFKHKVEAIDLGLRLTDIEWFANNGTPLPTERVNFGKVSKEAHRRRLRINGATEAEIEFLLRGEGNTGQRVELNAMTSDQFVAFVERKLTEHRTAKVIPSAETLAETYAALKRGDMARQALEAELARLNAEPIDVPADLAERVRAYLDEYPKETWDAAVRAVVEDDEDEDGEIGDRS